MALLSDPHRRGGRFRVFEDGWLLLAGAAVVSGVLAFLGGLWSLIFRSDLAMLLALPLTVLLHYWIAVGAYRRSPRAVASWRSRS